MRRHPAKRRLHRSSIVRGALVAATIVLVAQPGGSIGLASHGGTHIGTTTYSSDTTWTLAGSPYVLGGNVTVASGATLTIEPGVIVKLNGTGRELIVNGTLTAVGTAANRITFTSIQDDSVGGDSGGDGATTGAAGQWYRLRIAGGSSSQLKYVDVRYGGWGSSETTYGAVRVEAPALTIEQATIADSQQSGVQVSSSGAATIEHSTIERAKTGVYVNGGSATVSASTIRTNTKNGIYFSSPTGGSVNDSTITGNTLAGIVIYTGSGGFVPDGSRNNLYANNGGGGKQLDYTSLADPPPSYWKHNFWGREVYHRPNPSECGDAGYGGRLGYRTSSGDPPAGPLPYKTHVIDKPYPEQDVICRYDIFRIGPLEFSPFPFGELGAPIECVIGDGSHGQNPTEDQEDPINSATGSLFHQASDLELPGTGLPFAFTRSYNSLDPGSGPFGRGWTHSYAASLEVAANGDAQLRGEDGMRISYVKQQDGSFLAPNCARSTLSEFLGTYTLLRPDQVRYQFDSSGRLTSMRDRNNRELTFAYTNGKLTTIADTVGRAISLGYDATSGLLTSVAVPDGSSVSYGYTNGRLSSVTDAANKVWTYTYESHGFLEQEVDPTGDTVFRNVYGDDGRVAEQYNGLNNRTTFAWDYSTQTQTATDARGNTWKDVYSNNVILKRIDALGNTTQLGHNTSLDRTSVTSPAGATSTMTYDARGNLLTATAPASLGSSTKTYTYDAKNNVTTVTDARGKVTSYGYDAAGNNTSITQDGATVAQFTFNASGELMTSTDGNGRTTSYTYDGDGNLTSVTDPLGNKTTYSYDAAGRVTARVDPRGNMVGADPNQYKWTSTYDATGHVLTETDPLDNVTTYAYDAAGNRTSVTNANGKTTTYAYDPTNRLTSVTGPDGGVTTYTYDSVGNKVTEKNPNNKTTTYSYDADNRLISVTSPLGNKTTYSYDARGNLIKQVEPRGNVYGANPEDYATTFTYDAAGRQLTETDPLGNTTTYAYDAVGNQTSVTDANNRTTTYAYDGRGRLVSVTAPGGAVTSYTHDDNDNLLTRTDANNHTTTYGYDAADRLTSTTLPLGRQWTYNYDAAGNLDLTP